MAKTMSVEHGRIGPRQVGPVRVTPDMVRQYAGLSALGINLSNRHLQQMIDGIGLDSNDVGVSPAPLSSLTTGTVPTPVQFLQNWLPGFVRVLTTARKIDELIGISTVGAWEDEEVVQGMLEPLGVAVPYGDYTNVPFASWNPSWERRTVVRFEMGLIVGALEEARTARMRASTAAEKRASSALALDIQRNRVGFYGFNDGSGRTFGFLNDPSLPAYVTAPNGASGSPLWSGKTFNEITADFRLALGALQNQSGDNIDPLTANITAAIPTSEAIYLGVTNVQGNQSVRQYLAETFKGLRIVSAPELNDANGGVSAAYFYVESIQDGSSDDGRTWQQIVPTKFMTLGVERRSKTYVEDYSNATAGTLLKRPFGVYRLSGI